MEQTNIGQTETLFRGANYLLPVISKAAITAKQAPAVPGCCMIIPNICKAAKKNVFCWNIFSVPRSLIYHFLGIRSKIFKSFRKAKWEQGRN